jgi:hypothetical protein
MSKDNIFKKIASVSVTFLLICSFVSVPVSQTLTVHRAEAALATVANQVLQFVEEAGTYIQTALTAAESAIQSGILYSLQIKEYTLDAIAWALVNLLIKEMIKSTTKWVASGFQGSPAFVTDLKGFLLDIGDKVAGRFYLWCWSSISMFAI